MALPSLRMESAEVRLMQTHPRPQTLAFSCRVFSMPGPKHRRLLSDLCLSAPERSRFCSSMPHVMPEQADHIEQTIERQADDQEQVGAERDQRCLHALAHLYVTQSVRTALLLRHVIHGMHHVIAGRLEL